MHANGRCAIDRKYYRKVRRYLRSVTRQFAAIAHSRDETDPTDFIATTASPRRRHFASASTMAPRREAPPFPEREAADDGAAAAIRADAPAIDGGGVVATAAAPEESEEEPSSDDDPSLRLLRDLLLLPPSRTPSPPPFPSRSPNPPPDSRRPSPRRPSSSALSRAERLSALSSSGSGLASFGHLSDFLKEEGLDDGRRRTRAGARAVRRRSGQESRGGSSRNRSSEAKEVVERDEAAPEEEDGEAPSPRRGGARPGLLEERPSPSRMGSSSEMESVRSLASLLSACSDRRCDDLDDDGDELPPDEASAAALRDFRLQLQFWGKEALDEEAFDMLLDDVGYEREREGLFDGFLAEAWNASPSFDSEKREVTVTDVEHLYRSEPYRLPRQACFHNGEVRWQKGGAYVCVSLGSRTRRSSLLDARAARVARVRPSAAPRRKESGMICQRRGGGDGILLRCPSAGGILVFGAREIPVRFFTRRNGPLFSPSL
ncbi:hypothetical protein ACHAWF_011537 [Thalassiosira exigua]